MRSRVLITIIAIFIAVVILAGVFSSGFIAGRMLFPGSGTQAMSVLGDLSNQMPAATDPGATATPKDLGVLFEPFWQAWDLVHDQYVDQPVDDESLMRGAIKGMLESLGDPHTSYLDPDQNKLLNTQLKGEDKYEGIGAWVDTTSEYLTIISPMPGSPAENAGLKPGDKIIAVDGEDMTGIDGELVRKKVIGPAGSSVRLTIAREGQEPFDVNVKRASIAIPSLETRMLDNNIAYVHLFVFGDTTAADLKEALNEQMKKNPQGLILDLRYNGGGYLDTAIDVASQFIDTGTIMVEEFGDGKRKTYEARSGGIATDIPMVVLINEGSASASEIVAGAIQDRQRGSLVGVTSYGKGSVQIPTQLKDDEGAVRITIARWLTPNGRTIHQKGLEPDYVVPITDEDRSASRDPQLDKAIELLTQPK